MPNYSLQDGTPVIRTGMVAGKSEEVQLPNGRRIFVPTARIIEATETPELKVETIPAIDRYEQVKRYYDAGVVDAHWLLCELRQECRDEFLKGYGAPPDDDTLHTMRPPTEGTV